MSEITSFFERAKALGPVQAGEESLADVYAEFGEKLPAVQGLDLRTVPGELYHDLQAALYEHQELQEEEAERQREIDHEFNLGQARAAGMQGGHDPEVEQQLLYRDMSSGDRLHWQQLAENQGEVAHWNQEIDAAVKLGDQERANRAQYFLREALAKKEDLESKPFEGFQKAVAEDGGYWAELPEQYNSMSPEDKKQYKTHLREVIEKSHQSENPYLWAYDKENDKPEKILTGGPPAREVYDRISRHERLSEFDADERALQAANMGFKIPGGRLIRESYPQAEGIEVVGAGRPAVVEEVKHTEPEPAGDIEVVDVSGGGVPETTYHDAEEEPQPEPDAPAPKTNIHTFM